MMILITSQVGCRNCLQSDGIPRSYNLKNSQSVDYISKTEYEIMEYLEKHSIHNHCDFCNSNDLEYHEIKIDTRPLYDYGKIVRRCDRNDEYLFMINLDKRNGSLLLTEGGNSQLPKDFIKHSIKIILNELEKKSIPSFTNHLNGNFFMALTGNMTPFSNTVWTQIERLRYHGISKNEILSSISEFENKLNKSL